MSLIFGRDVADWGFIPTFLHDDDPRPAKEQFADRYVSGWNKFEGFTFDESKGTLKYPGDPVMYTLGAMIFRDEMILLFPSAWVLIMQPDHTWEVARMD
jgi:hypothetical protein